LRHKKVKIGNMMRIIKSQKYYKLSENLNETYDIVEDIPGLEKIFVATSSEEDASSRLNDFLKM
jgi:hypothetical protein